MVATMDLPQIWAYMAGCLTVIVLSPLVVWVARQVFGEKATRKRIYGLHHGILNADIPPKTMWMNMGYWDKGSGFPAACSRLLNEVLKSADLIEEDGYRTGRWPIKLVDLGFGCADQTIDMVKKYPTLISSYIGLTIDPTQYEFAHHRLVFLRLIQDSTSPSLSSSNHPTGEGRSELGNFTSHETTLFHKKLEDHARGIDGKESEKVSIFCADAAQPENWSPGLKEAIKPNLTKQLSEKSSKPSLSKLRQQKTWILALDCLYHFSPSRQPIFSHARQKLQASIMAFDLLFGEDVTVLERFGMRIIALTMGCPMGNFMSVAEYKTQLLKAGYEEGDIEITDISEYVFAGLADYLERRDEELKMYLGRGIGLYKGFGWVLRWWASSGVIKGCIIVARI